MKSGDDILNKIVKFSITSCSPEKNYAIYFEKI